jgi:hypothetical protein
MIKASKSLVKKVAKLLTMKKKNCMIAFVLNLVIKNYYLLQKNVWWKVWSFSQERKPEKAKPGYVQTGVFNENILT